MSLRRQRWPRHGERARNAAASDHRKLETAGSATVGQAKRNNEIGVGEVSSHVQADTRTLRRDPSHPGTESVPRLRSSERQRGG